MQKIWWRLWLAVGIAVGLRFGLLPVLQSSHSVWLQVGVGLGILGLGVSLVLQPAAKIIEETTEVLSERTKLASGLLQSLGTAFPDMALGIVAAMVSLRLRATDPAGAVSYAIIAAATTFGSNIYNIGHAAWCVWRQNQADLLQRVVLMFPGLRGGGLVRPVATHTQKPTMSEFKTATTVIVALSLLTMTVAISMVLFGRLGTVPGQEGDVYQLTRPVGMAIALLCGWLLYVFRNNHRVEATLPETHQEENLFRRFSSGLMMVQLVLSGLAILFAAESMIHAIAEVSQIFHIPVTIAGVLSGIVGCLGEMLVVHNFSVHPTGRIGDAVMGVAMDNIVTTLGAALVAVMGGIFLGGSALITIFAIILGLNVVLLWQVSILQVSCSVLPHPQKS